MVKTTIMVSLVLFLVRGQDYVPAFDVAPDWESYEFTKLDGSNEDDKNSLTICLLGMNQLLLMVKTEKLLMVKSSNKQKKKWDYQSFLKLFLH